MAMSWGWTPLCRIGSDRYRIGSATDRTQPQASPVVFTTSQCGIVSAPQLPPETSIVLSTQPQGTVPSQLPPPSPPRTTVSSTSFSSSQTLGYQPATSSAEERVVRRSPRLARGTRVSYRDDGDAQGSRRRNQWNNTVQEQQQTMWSSDRSQSNSSQQQQQQQQQQLNKNYSVYNYDGQITPCINTNSSLSVIYNNNKNISNVSQPRYQNLPYQKPNFTVPAVKVIPGKVTIKSLDFYEIMTTLVQEEIVLEGIRPSQCTASFLLTEPDVNNILDKKKKHPYLIQLRFCKLDSTTEQNDYYPATHHIVVNQRFVLLPGLETMPRGSMRPMDITNLCHINSRSCNFITIRCMESCKMFIYLVQKYTSQDLLCRLETRPPIKEEDTVNEIKKKLQADQTDGIAAATLQFSLLCPLSRIRIKLPCRASTCTHLQCFDAATYLQLNECKPKWSCPVCYQPALYKNLQIDGYFKKIIDEKTTKDKIELQPDGTWTLVDATAKKKPMGGADVSIEKRKDNSGFLEPGHKMVVLDSDEDASVANTPSRQETQENSNPSRVVPPHRSDSPEVVTLSDDDSPGGESPQVTASTYPTHGGTLVGNTATTESNDITLESEHLDYFNELWEGAFSRQFGNNYTGLHPLEHSNNCYIPLERTPLPSHLSNSVTITHKSSERRTSSSDRLHKGANSSRGLQEKSNISKAQKSKTKKVQKVKLRKMALREMALKISKQNHSGNAPVKHKRRRILSVSSESSDSECESGRRANLKSSHKKLSKQKKKPKSKHQRRATDSSEDDKSSACSSSSKKSTSSVNLISSGDSSCNSSSSRSNNSNSNSSSGSSSSSSSSESSEEEAHQSDSSFEMGGCLQEPEASSRVLRSARPRPKRK